MTKLNRTACAAFVLGLCAPVVYGQVGASLPSAASVQGQSTRTMESLELQRKLQQEAESRDKNINTPTVDDKTQAPTEAKKPAGQETLIPVSTIEVDHSEILTEKEINDLVAPYEGRKVSIGELFDLVEAFNKLYAERKFTTARALLPPQKIKDGVVHIQLAEGHVGEIQLEGNDSTNESYIKSRLALKEGELVNLESLQENLAFFNSVNDLSVRAELKPGREFGTVDAVLKAEEPQRNNLSVSVDNVGRQSIGLERLGVTYTNASLFGFRDALTMSAYVAQGTQTQSVAYSIPVGPYGTRLGMGYDWSDIKVKNGSFRSLDIGGSSNTSTLLLKHPFYVTPATKVEGFLNTQYKESDTTFSGLTISRLKVRTEAVGFSAQHFDEAGVWQTSQTFTGGEETQTGKNFTRYNFDVNRVMRLDGDMVATFRGNGQWSEHPLLPSTEQYQLGGLATVRGFTEGLLTGYRGYFVSAELNFPLRWPGDDASKNLFGGQVRGAVFVDHGGAFPYKGNGQGWNSTDYLTSVGFGALLNFTKVLSGQVYVGVPTSENRGESGPRINFTLQAALF